MLHFNTIFALKCNIMFSRKAVEDLKNWYAFSHPWRTSSW